MLASRIAIVVFVSGHILFAQSSQRLGYTGHLASGRAWTAMSTDFKLGYVLALGEAPSLFDLKTGNHVYVFNSSSTHEEVIAALDQLYSDPTNLPIPIVFAYRVVAMKVEGASAERIEDELSRLRSYAATRRQ